MANNAMIDVLGPVDRVRDALSAMPGVTGPTARVGSRQLYDLDQAFTLDVGWDDADDATFVIVVSRAGEAAIDAAARRVYEYLADQTDFGLTMVSAGSEVVVRRDAVPA